MLCVYACVHVCACVRACVRGCARACACVCVSTFQKAVLGLHLLRYYFVAYCVEARDIFLGPIETM